MKFSIIWKLSEQESENTQTAECLQEELKEVKEKPQLLLYSRNQENITLAERQLDGICELTIYKETEFTDAQMYQDAAQKANGDYVTQLSGGDTWEHHTLSAVEAAAAKYPKYRILMTRKIMPDGKEGEFCKTASDGKEVLALHLQRDLKCYPFYFGGTFIQKKLLIENSFQTEPELELEREFFLSACAKEGRVLVVKNAAYHSASAREGDITFFKGIYEEEWYEESFSKFWLPFLEKMKKEYGEVPKFIQYHLMFSLRSRIESNRDNRNKHVIPEGREWQCLEWMGKALQYVQDDIMLNCHKISSCSVQDTQKWIYGILKYGPEYKFDKYFLSGSSYYGKEKTVFNKILTLKTNLVFMNYRDGKLEIDGTVHPILYAMADKVYLMTDNKKYQLNYNERYTITKVFGVSIYKSRSFHVSIPVKELSGKILFCMAEVGGELVKAHFSFESHFSRMSGAFVNSYWCFGEDKKYMALKREGGLLFQEVHAKNRRRQEWKLRREMFLSFEKKAWLFLFIRIIYFLLKPFMKRKPIWMYLDKIYKGGDSSEYLYRYASRQNNHFKHYYLIDKHTSDYKRLKQEGFHPLVRGTVKHRLVFLMADMMVISNSTVFAFNNFGMKNSSYVRDLVDFHVCCVQHGMSVQKIAVAQNRLRDNTRLYFCASQYEIENLSKPIYDYVGYDALKLTGVPRYDGLVNDDKKQIMISPTWRMQAAVPVRTSEGEQRDYNPMFKESSYFRVFNSLINDPRLIEAAQKYGYKMKYVLHPIVSAQVGDFDKNEYVDIIPAVGDMSYEKMFCESSLMVTDFSGIQFDFAYMRKPLVYLHHKDIPQHYEEGTFFYETMGFGEICHDNEELIDLLCDYMEHGCKMKEEYKKRADDFFYYSDHENCKRIYDTMVEYQDKYVAGGNGARH